MSILVVGVVGIIVDVVACYRRSLINIVVVLPLATHARQLVKICTDSASRGLDLPAVRVVVQAEFVLDVEQPLF